ncbi:MAG: arginyl-tRNA synthetase [Parcubacteria group bacterium Gr01-1014_8]|nr:MAG: arginyl-tRNA synthetase [Parcubacteria group bacterium Gr01-1014_8]
MDPVLNVREKLVDALKDIGVSITVTDITLGLTDNLSFGDYATSVALAYAKEAGVKPRELAEKLVASMGSVEGISKIDIAGPGFINFTLDPRFVYKSLEAGLMQEEQWGSGLSRKGKKMMIEYTDPNPFKEFHIGHLVPNTLGESISRLLMFSGAEVKRANYQGDVGIHVAKSLFIQLEKGITDPTIEDLASAYPEGSRRYDEDPEAKKAIDELNKKIYDKSDEKINALYAKGRALSLAHFEELYKVLGTTFDYYFFESETGPIGVKEVRAHPDVFEESEGAVVFKGEKYGLHTRVFINKLGLPTYEAKELGLARMKAEKYQFDLTLTITANEQAEYFKVVMKAMELSLPDLRGKLAFKTNGLLRFADGKMSSRLGNIITGEELIGDLKEKAMERASKSRATDAQKLAGEVAVGAIKYQILKQGFGKDIIFDRERALSLEGDSGPYLQYAHARTSAIVEKARGTGIVVKFDTASGASELVRRLYRFNEIVMRATDELEPHLVATYLINLAAAFNSWYANEQILDGTLGASHKVAITDITRQTLKNGLWLLGIPAPEKM